METVISRLAAWHRAYLRLQDARARMKAAPPESAAWHAVDEEVHHLQDEADEQLCKLQRLSGTGNARSTPMQVQPEQAATAVTLPVMPAR